MRPRLFAAIPALVVVLVPGPAGAAEPAPPPPSSEQARQVADAVRDHVSMAAAREGGVFHLPDPRTGDRLELELVEIGIVGRGGVWWVHDPSHPAGSHEYFACATFRPVGAPPPKLYDVDFEVATRNGMLVVTDVRVHRVPRLVEGKWTFEPLLRNDGAGFRKLE